MEITRILVMNTNGTDRVYVHTDLPSPFPPEVSKTHMTMSFEVQKGKGLQYVRDNFNMEPEFLDTEVSWKRDRA